MRHQTTSSLPYVVVLRRGIAAITLAAWLAWGVSSSAAVTRTRSGVSESAARMANDQRIARDARLRLSDLPPGWVAQNAASTPTADAPCPGLRRAGGAISAGMLSPAFAVSTGKVESAQSETYIYADTSLARQWFTVFSSRRTQVCLARVLRKEVTAALGADGIRLGPITLRRLPAAPVGNQDAGFRVTVPAFTSNLTIKVDADVVFVRVGRGLEIFSLAGVGSPFDPRLEGTLVRTVSVRLAGDLRSAP